VESYGEAELANSVHFVSPNYDSSALTHFAFLVLLFVSHFRSLLCLRFMVRKFMGLSTGKWDFKFWYLSSFTGRGRGRGRGGGGGEGEGGGEGNMTCHWSTLTGNLIGLSFVTIGNK